MLNLNELYKITIINRVGWLFIIYPEDLYMLYLYMLAYRFSRIGNILLIRQFRHFRQDYGVIGIWIINTHGYIQQVINFDEPFNERIINNMSSKVRNLTKTPFLTRPFINMFRSGRSYYIAIDYIKEILREKQDQCNLNNFRCPNIITDDIVFYFLDRLVNFT